MTESVIERLRRKFGRAHDSIGSDQWRRICTDIPLIGRYPPSDRARLRELTEAFLERKRFEGALGLELDEEIRLLISAQACIPILGLSLDWLDDWRSVVVYPGDFVAHRVIVDEAGVVHECDDPLSGEAWGRGPVILSLEGVREDAQGGQWGNLVIHEIAHKLDMRNGVANGMPPLHRDMSRARWTEIWSSAYAELVETFEGGGEPWIDEHAVEDPAEFFASMSEAFFTCPRDLQHEHADVYAQLRQFYRQDPVNLPPTSVPPARRSCAG